MGIPARVSSVADPKPAPIAWPPITVWTGPSCDGCLSASFVFYPRGEVPCGSTVRSLHGSKYFLVEHIQDLCVDGDVEFPSEIAARRQELVQIIQSEDIGVP
jgi:hypothetical protein